ncbi:MAG: hypothetical protein VX694_09040 [Planctomycetota bacterium]|nr:hypothetical protein [Planctomycetota bacterium]
MESSETLSKILKFPKAFLDWLIQSIVGTAVVFGVCFLVWKFFKDHILELPPLMKWPILIGFACFASVPLMAVIMIGVYRFFWTLYPGLIKESSRQMLTDPMIFETVDGESSVEGLYLERDKTRVKFKRVDNHKEVIVEIRLLSEETIEEINTQEWAKQHLKKNINPGDKIDFGNVPETHHLKNEERKKKRPDAQ